MLETALDMHDALLLNAPEGARHDSDVCPFCTDWAMTDDGIPSGASRLEFADAKSPYGSVTYADPGYQADKVKRYPIDTEAHARAAWSYIHQASNAAKYSADQLSTMRTKISNALKKFGAEVKDEAEVETPGSVSDDSSRTQSATGTQPDSASEGGTPNMATDTTETISTETHQALLTKAVTDATATLTTENASLTARVAELEAEVTSKTSELAAANTENERINGELDSAQVSLKAAQDEANALKDEAAAKEAELAKAEIASARAQQVRNLGLFTEEFITERSSKWADVDEAAWTERLDEWKVAKGTSAPGTTSTTTETASAITGTRGTEAGQQPSARRQALGLPTTPITAQ